MTVPVCASAVGELAWGLLRWQQSPGRPATIVACCG